MTTRPNVFSTRFGTFSGILVHLFTVFVGSSVPLAAQRPADSVEESRPLSEDARFVDLFDGRSLSGWRAVPPSGADDWTVENGTIVGTGSADRLSYLVWKDDHLTDFELELEYRLPGRGNTGIEIRCRPDPSGKRPLEGYHADLGHVGIGPHILGAWDFHFAERREPPCPRGTRLIIDEQDRARTVPLPEALTAEDVRPGDWNDVRVEARGRRFRFHINGKLASEFTDDAVQGRLDRGGIALQIHDRGMQVQFRNVRLRRMASGESAAEQTPADGPLEAFLGEPSFDVDRVHEGGRFPNVVVARDGSVLAVWGGVVLRRSVDGGVTWGPTIDVAKGFMGGGVTVDETTGDVLVFVEEQHPPAALTVHRSRDHGETWAPFDVTIAPDAEGRVPSMHMNEHGITLSRGEHAGRLLRATRDYAGRNDRAKWPEHYTNAIFSDDNGRTWRTSQPFPAKGTGEAAVVELSNGSLYYNSRRHWAPEGADPRRRWTARSEDGGETWKDLAFCEVLPDGPQNTDYGCMAGLARLPIRGRDVLLYSNCDSAKGRDHGTVWASFDGGRTWPLKRLAVPGAFAYSSLAAGRPGTKSEGTVFLHFEHDGGSSVARFDLAWMLGGQPTGDGRVPDWVEAAN